MVLGRLVDLGFILESAVAQVMLPPIRPEPLYLSPFGAARRQEQPRHRRGHLQLLGFVAPRVVEP